MFTEFILLYKVNAVYLHCVYPFIRPKKDNFNISHSKLNLSQTSAVMVENDISVFIHNFEIYLVTTVTNWHFAQSVKSLLLMYF